MCISSEYVMVIQEQYFLYIMNVASKKIKTSWFTFTIFCVLKKCLKMCLISNKNFMYYTCNTDHFQISVSDLPNCSYLFQEINPMIGHGPQWIGTTWRGRWSPAVSPLSDLNKLSVGPLASTASPIRSLAPIGTHINHSTYTYIGKGRQNAARPARRRR